MEIRNSKSDDLQDILKLDTHNDNKPMQNLLKKLGFVPCGIITVEDGTERIAFQRYSEK